MFSSQEAVLGASWGEDGDTISDRSVVLFSCSNQQGVSQTSLFKLSQYFHGRSIYAPLPSIAEFGSCFHSVPMERERSFVGIGSRPLPPADLHKFHVSRLAAPLLLIGFGGGSSLYSSPDDLRHRLRDHFVAHPGVLGPVSDVIQYAPMVTPYVLKLAGVRGLHTCLDYSILLATSYLSLGVMVNAGKYAFGVLRPDGSSHNSFPSGHTATAFMGAELLRMEYRDVSPWIGVAGYAVAAFTGFCRIEYNRHWITDVLAGAGVGILSARIGYWCLPWVKNLFSCTKKEKSETFSAPYHSTYAFAAPYYDGSCVGASACLLF